MMGIVVVVLFIGVVFYIYSYDLLSYEFLVQYQLFMISWIYLCEGCIIDEFVKEWWFFVFVEEILDLVKQVFILVEDKNFYQYVGYDVCGIVVVFVEVVWFCG